MKGGDWAKNRRMINQYIVLGHLGQGSYAEVRKCKCGHQLFAIKIINRPKGFTQSLSNDVKREIAIMKKLAHENVLKLHEVMDDPRQNKLYLVLEYMEKGDLLKAMEIDPNELLEPPSQGSSTDGVAEGASGSGGIRTEATHSKSRPSPKGKKVAPTQPLEMPRGCAASPGN